MHKTTQEKVDRCNILSCNVILAIKLYHCSINHKEFYKHVVNLDRESLHSSTYVHDRIRKHMLKWKDSFIDLSSNLLGSSKKRST